MMGRAGVSFRWRFAFISVCLFLVFYMNSGEEAALGFHSRHLLQDTDESDVDGDTTMASGAAEADTNAEATPSRGGVGGGAEDLCAEKNKTKDPLFPTDIFSDEALASGAVIFHVIGVLYMFYALALVCDHFFVPALDVIIEKFGISPDVAGATLMAAGGSAPELFTSVIGVFIAVSDVGIGTIVGSAVFNVLFVIAACAFASTKALSLTAWPLLRDTFFYSVALILLVVFFMDNLIKWWEALILFLWYGAYVSFMKFNVPMEKKFLEMFPSLAAKEEEEEGVELRAGFKYNPHRRPLLEIMQGKVTGLTVQATEMQNVEGGIQGLKKKLEAGEEEKTEKVENLVAEKQDDAKDFPVQNEEDYKDVVMAGPQGSILSKIVWFITMPLMVPMWITIPDPNNPRRKKFFALSFLISILWIMVFSYLMVWWATTIGNVVGISDAVMGLTFLAAGTSVPDLITSVLVAKQGHGDMAVSSSIGSNIFDVTVGLPLPWLLYTAINQQPMSVSSVGMGCNIGMLFLMLLLVMISIMAFKWKMTKVMGGVMMLLYGVFLVVSLGLSSCWFSCPF